MSQSLMDRRFAAAVRAHLVSDVALAHRPRTARRWVWRAGGVVVLLGVGGTGYALTNLLPGATEVTRIAVPTVVTHTGSLDVELGARPAGATAVEIGFRCLSAGDALFPDGSRVRCEANETGAGSAFPVQLRVELADDQHSLRLEADRSLTWTASVRYVSERVTDWAVNANGQTYGVANQAGEPDLIAVIATNGRQGYVLKADEVRAVGGAMSSPEEALAWQREHAGTDDVLPVFLEDGVTRIGDFVIHHPASGR